MTPLASPPPLHPREAEIRGIAALEAEVRKTGAGIPPLMMARTPENLEVLSFLAGFVTEDISPDLAMTDPARYRKLCRLKMEIVLRGYHAFFKELRDSPWPTKKG